MSVKRTIDTCRRRGRTSDASLIRSISIIYSPCRPPLLRLLQAEPLSPQYGFAKKASPSSILKTCFLSLFGSRIPCEESRSLRRSIRNRYPLPLGQEITGLWLRASEDAYNSIINNEHIYPFGEATTPRIHRSLYIHI